MSPDERGEFERITRMLEALAGQRAKEWYTVEDFAALAGRAPFTVRQWANLGQVNAVKCNTRCGPGHEWRISHAERLRYEREGLLPLNPRRNWPDRPDGPRAA